MNVDILTLFPDMFAPLSMSMIGRAQQKGLLHVNVVNIRDYSTEKRSRTDDAPFGGGPGMLMMAQPIFDCLEALDGAHKKLIYMSPRGRVIDRAVLEDLVREEDLLILCGHYEGVDQRVLDAWDFTELSIGDYVLTGGELPAMVLVDAAARLIPGVLSSREGALGESVYSGLLEYPQYTQPRDFRGRKVPEVLLSGDHGKVDAWRLEQALRITKEKRPALFEEYVKNREGLDKDTDKLIEKVLDMV